MNIAGATVAQKPVKLIESIRIVCVIARINYVEMFARVRVIKAKVTFFGKNIQSSGRSVESLHRNGCKHQDRSCDVHLCRVSHALKSIKLRATEARYSD